MIKFIKSIGRWFKSGRDEAKCLSEVVSIGTPVSTPLIEVLAPFSYQLKGIDRDIEETLKAIAAAEKAKKKRSHLKSKYRALKLQRLQIENKISDYKNVW